MVETEVLRPGEAGKSIVDLGGEGIYLSLMVATFLR